MVFADLEKNFKKLTDPPLKFAYQLNNQSSKAILKQKKEGGITSFVMKYFGYEEHYSIL